MRRFAESITAAVGMLTLILGGYAYVLMVSFKADANAKEIESVRIKEENLEEMKTDVAVIKEQVLEIRKILDK
jgi:hypothetical protein